MTKSKKTEGGIPVSVHRVNAGLHKAGLTDKATMREFADLSRRSIAVTDLTKEEIEQIMAGRMDRKHEHLNGLLKDE